MKNSFSIVAAVAVLGVAAFLQFGGDAVHAQSTTTLAGDACTPGTDLTVTVPNLDYGSVTAADYVAGFTQTVTNQTVSFTDNCGTGTYTYDVSFTDMVGTDNGTNSISNADLIWANEDTTDEYFTVTAGNTALLEAAFLGTAGPTDYSGSVTQTILEREVDNGAVGDLEINITSSVVAGAGEYAFDSSYDGTWNIVRN